MNRFLKRAAVLAAAAVFSWQSLAFAADLTTVRFHSGSEHDRVVFDLSELPSYKESLSDDRRTLTLDFAGTKDKRPQKLPVKSSRIESISYASKGGHLIVTMRLKAGLAYDLHTLKNPVRLFVDVMPSGAAEFQTKTPAGSDRKGQTKPAAGAGASGASTSGRAGTIDGDYIEDVAPGLTKHTYVYWDDYGKVSAWLIEADPSKYDLRLVLAKGKVPGRETVSGIAARAGGTVAVNASYFASSGDILGVTRINGQTVGTTYYTRSAFGLRADGTPLFGTVSYDGSVTMGGVTQPVGGVDCERGADSLVIYNRAYGTHTDTNEYGRDYVVRGGRVTDIRQNDAPIPQDGVVVSVHGTMADAFAGVQVGDPVTISEDFGLYWQDAVTLVGCGPRLVENGRVHVTASEEEFPSDIRVGRAPRTAVGVTKDGRYLLAVVDGRQSHSVGLTLTDWAKLLVKFGARDAINLDGGGSTDLVVNGEVQNSPSDGQERAVGDALVLVPKR